MKLLYHLPNFIVSCLQLYQICSKLWDYQYKTNLAQWVVLNEHSFLNLWSCTNYLINWNWILYCFKFFQIFLIFVSLHFQIFLHEYYLIWLLYIQKNCYLKNHFHLVDRLRDLQPLQQKLPSWGYYWTIHFECFFYTIFCPSELDNPKQLGLFFDSESKNVF